MAIRKKFNWMKWVLILALLAGGVGAGMWYRNRSKTDPVEFKTATLARGEITQTVTANGQITPVKNVQVGSQISGIILEVKVDYNDSVKEGQVVAQIDPSTYQQNVDLSEAELLNARAALELAELNYRRAQSLRSNELISVSEADKTLADLHQGQAVVRMREAALKKSKVDLERTTIYAPISGVVITRNVDVGQTVAASFNTPTLFQIANDLSKMEIGAMVSEADVGGVAQGQNATFTVDAFPSRQFEGQIKMVRYAPTTNQNVVTYTAVVDVNNSDLKLRPGMTANLSIITAQKSGVLKIPNSALRYRPPETAMVKSPTNSPAGSLSSTNGPGGSNLVAKAGDPNGQAAPDSGSTSREERRRRFESMTPEQRAAFRESMRARGGEGGGPGMGRPSGGGAGRSDTSGARTVYLLVKTNSPAGTPIELAKPVTVKLGISDGAFTEVLDGLNEGDAVITGQNTPAPVASTMSPGGSPFGRPFGGGGGFRPR